MVIASPPKSGSSYCAVSIRHNLLGDVRSCTLQVCVTHTETWGLLVQHLLRSLLVLISVLLTACSTQLRDSTIYSPSAAIGSVRNGTAFDQAYLDLGQHQTLVVPQRTIVRRIVGNGPVILQMEKTVGYLGHPTQRITIDAERAKMGCAFRSMEDEIRLATFGETMTPEGGKTIALTAFVPSDIQVARDDSHEMPRSGTGRVASSALRREPSTRSPTMLSDSTGQRWTVIPDEPDARAAKLKRT